MLAFNEGKFHFNRLCNNCHIAPETKKHDQYSFVNLFERLPDPGEEFFIKYITNSKSLKVSGDEYAVKLDHLYDSPFEHLFRDSLTKSQMASLVNYLKVVDRKVK